MRQSLVRGLFAAALVASLGGCHQPVPAACKLDTDCATGSSCSSGKCAVCACAASEVCLRGACYSPRCGDFACRPGQGCVDGSCLESACIAVSCPAGQRCAKGTCYPIDCGGITCSALEVCSGGQCSLPSCMGVVCPTGATCVDGSCVAQTCAGATCAQGAFCQDGQCTSILCAGVTCASGTACAGGRCLPTSCGASPCPSGQVCASGACVDAACVGVTCVAPARCESGACVQGGPQCHAGDPPVECGAVGSGCTQACGADGTLGACLRPGGGPLDTNTDPSNCGACGNVCPTPSHAEARCVKGVCGRGPCAQGWFDLDAAVFGCETSCDSTGCTGPGGPVTVTSPPLPETGLVFAGVASGSSFGAAVQTSGQHTNVGVLGESTPPLVGGAVQATGTAHRNVPGLTSALRHE